MFLQISANYLYSFINMNHYIVLFLFTYLITMGNNSSSTNID